MTDARARAKAAAGRRSLRAKSLESLTRRLLNYFSAVGGPHDHVFTLRDINLQVMMNTFAPEERALLDVVITGLVNDGSLQRDSATDFVLTDKGLRRVRRDREGLRDVGGPLPDGSPRAHARASRSVAERDRTAHHDP